MRKYIISVAMILSLVSCNKDQEDIKEIKSNQNCIKHYYKPIYDSKEVFLWQEYHSHPVQNGETSTNGKKISIDGYLFYEIKCK